MESCRRATPDDLEEIVRLAQGLREELGSMRGGDVWLAREARPEPLDETYQPLIDHQDALVVVGAIDASAVGFGVAEIETMRTGERLGRVTELFVEAGARSVGVGEAMAATLIDFCTERGCIGIDTMALPGHRATKNFFEEQGFTARSLVMHRSLRSSE
ncbi:MAG: GNAT family N-acetyltransferase [Acidimicrobiia bacterium]